VKLQRERLDGKRVFLLIIYLRKVARLHGQPSIKSPLHKKEIKMEFPGGDRVLVGPTRSRLPGKEGTGMTEKKKDFSRKNKDVWGGRSSTHEPHSRPGCGGLTP